MSERHRAPRQRVARGSLTGALAPRGDAMPGLRGTLTIETETVLRPGARVYLTGWIREAAGVPFVSIVVEQGDGGGRLR